MQAVGDDADDEKATGASDASRDDKMRTARMDALMEELDKINFWAQHPPAERVGVRRRAG